MNGGCKKNIVYLVNSKLKTIPWKKIEITQLSGQEIRYLKKITKNKFLVINKSGESFTFYDMTTDGNLLSDFEISDADYSIFNRFKSPV